MSETIEGAVILLALVGGIAGAFLITRWFNWVAFGQRQTQLHKQEEIDEEKDESKN